MSMDRHEGADGSDSVTARRGRMRPLVIVLLALATLLVLALAWRTVAAGGSDAGAADGDWPLYGRDLDANHYSPLDQINQDNIGQLGLAWYYDLESTGSLYTSPIEVGGVLYFAQGYSVLHAMDARTGRLLWKYDPQATRNAGEKMRAAWGSRGIAYWDGKIYTGTVDGRLIAVDAGSGKLVWSVDTTEGPDDGRYLTGPPWIFDGKVAIGHGGADFALVRGYVTTYDAATGEQLWRFHTVPGNPADGFENEAMEMAARTWTGEWWKFGGGGTVWNAMAYDRKYNRLYIGVGNGTPWNARARSPGGGDNLFLCSIVALDADTGEYVWHYQMNPGETWDYNAAMDIQLTELEVDGELRPVLLHAPKNGFFYVIDRETGKLVSAEKFVPVSWADRIDLETGRPVENPAARFDGAGFALRPSPAGGHNAQPMSFSPQTGLTYIPAQDTVSWFSDEGVDTRNWQPKKVMGYYSALTPAQAPEPLPPPTYFLLAWDAAAQRERWRYDLPQGWGGGAISTGGQLVFIGRSDGKFVALGADTGAPLWQFDAQAGISSQPITYEVDGEQYVTLLAGYRGIVTASPWDYRTQKRRVLTFRLGARGSLPAPERLPPQPFAPAPGLRVDPALAEAGLGVYLASHCSSCHGIGLQPGGMAPDLRKSGIPHSDQTMRAVLHQGALLPNGMPVYPELSPADIVALRHYIAREAHNASKGSAGEQDETVIRQ